MEKSEHYEINLLQAITLYVGTVLGAGVLFAPGVTATIAGPASIISWGLMCILVFPLALTMGHLSAKFPHVGGVSHFVTLAFGEKVGSLFGWFFIMSVIIMAPVMALTGASYLSSINKWSEQTTFIVAIIMLTFSIIINYLGVKTTGRVQTIIVSCILCSLVFTISGSIKNIEISNFSTFIPHGGLSIGTAIIILFWCFTGWEAISNLAGEIENRQKSIVRAISVAATIISTLYFAIAFITIGTNSYNGDHSTASLSIIAEKAFGTFGQFIIGFIGVFVCVTTSMNYIGGAARTAYSLVEKKQAPLFLSVESKKFKTPVGSLCFLSSGFVIVLLLYKYHVISMIKLLTLPNATLILTYIGGCIAGIKLFKKDKKLKLLSGISCFVVLTLFLFVGSSLLYPLLIIIVFMLHNYLKIFITKRRKLVNYERVEELQHPMD